MTTRSMDMNWKMRAIRVLPMFLLPALSSATYTAFVSFTRMCKCPNSKGLQSTWKLVYLFISFCKLEHHIFICSRPSETLCLLDFILKFEIFNCSVLLFLKLFMSSDSITC